ncbi:class I adenylate-forming enzyme family protein [Deferrisoma palaeochoriense]
MSRRGARALARAMAPDRWVATWAARRPGGEALRFGERVWTWADLEAEVEATARWLRAAGVGPGDRVACFHRNHPHVVFLFLGASRVGAVFNPWNARLAPGETQHRFEDAQPRLLLVEPELRDRVARDVLTSGRAVGFREGAGEGGGGAGGPRSPDSPQALLYTSGTTGRPKGALLPMRKGFFNALNAQEFLGLGPGDRMLVMLPLFHSGALFIQVVPALYAGASVALFPRFDAEAVVAALREGGVTHFLAVPTVLRRVVEAGGPECLSGLRACGVGGEPVPPELIGVCLEAGVEVRQLYGQTETSIVLWASAEDLRQRPGTLGRPVRHAEVALGRGGEIRVRGPTVFLEYWGDPDLTREALRGGWFHTGDLARVDDAGYWHLAGRAKEMYISGGENVYPAEVEAVLRSHPAVADAAVVGVPDPVWGEAGRAFVELRPGASVTGEDLLAWCANRLARFKCPREIVFLDALPRTELGKIRKEALQAFGKATSP